jgi:hypothetical protein
LTDANGYRAGNPMDYSREMIGYLEAADVDGMRRLWRKIGAGYPQHDDRGTLIAIHMARTACEAVRFPYRAWSHAWLIDHGLPSQLPDELKPRAQRMHPVTQHAVGIAVKSKFPIVQTEVTKAMQGAVLEAEADGRLADSPHVRARMAEARAYIKRKLFG